jgi:hypothetical protein
MHSMKVQRAQVTITLEGTPEQIRRTYRNVLDCLDDVSDIYKNDAPTSGCYMTFDLDEDWRKPADPAKVRAFLLEGIHGCIPRTLDYKPAHDGPEDFGSYGPPDVGPSDSRTLGLI